MGQESSARSLALWWRLKHPLLCRALQRFKGQRVCGPPGVSERRLPAPLPPPPFPAGSSRGRGGAVARRLLYCRGSRATSSAPLLPEVEAAPCPARGGPWRVRFSTPLVGRPQGSQSCVAPSPFAPPSRQHAGLPVPRSAPRRDLREYLTRLHRLPPAAACPGTDCCFLLRAASLPLRSLRREQPRMKTPPMLWRGHRESAGSS